MLRILSFFPRSRGSYWKSVLEAATRYRHAFDRAMMLAIMGHHFETLTRIVRESDSQ